VCIICNEKCNWVLESCCGELDISLCTCACGRTCLTVLQASSAHGHGNYDGKDIVMVDMIAMAKTYTSAGS
jgi:hypothetical protein